MIQPCLGCYAVYEPTEEGWDNWELNLRSVTNEFTILGMKIVVAPEAVMDLSSMERVASFFKDKNLDMLFALIVSWSFDHYTIELQQRLRIPVAVRAIPGISSGSIVATQQIGSILKDLGVKYRIFYGEVGDLTVTREVINYAKACGIVRALKGARMAVIGHRTEGMTPTAVDEVEILRLFGMRLIHYGLRDIEQIAVTIRDKDAISMWHDVKAQALEVLSQDEYGIQAVRYFLACKELVADQNLDAITIGSYPRCQGVMCIPIAWLNETGIPTGCEGDVNSTINMFILSKLTNDPIHFGEMLAYDPHEETLVTSHCGCGSPSLADEKGFSIVPVRLANDGVSIRYCSKSGPITYVNLVGRKNNYRLCAFEGEALPTEMVFEGNPLRFRINGSFSEIWTEVDRFGFGHHWMTAYTKAVPILLEFCKLVGIQGVFPDHRMVV